jgi:pectin methylesterase-like acyl-CoA thioesterase
MLRSTLAALVGGTLLCAPAALADVLTVAVDGSGDYSRIQDAIHASTGGDTILVSPGVYQERISIARKSD